MIIFLIFVLFLFLFVLILLEWVKFYVVIEVIVNDVIIVNGYVFFINFFIVLFF